MLGVIENHFLALRVHNLYCLCTEQIAFVYLYYDTGGTINAILCILYYN